MQQDMISPTWITNGMISNDTWRLKNGRKSLKEEAAQEDLEDLEDSVDVAVMEAEVQTDTRDKCVPIMDIKVNKVIKVRKEDIIHLHNVRVTNMHNLDTLSLMGEQTHAVIVAMIVEQDAAIMVATLSPAVEDEDVLLQDVDVQGELSQRHTMSKNIKNQKNTSQDLMKCMQSRALNLPTVLDPVQDDLLRIKSNITKKRNTIGIRKTFSSWILMKNKRNMVITDNLEVNT
jgi:hypothetical protein